ncbi:MAG: class I SAM-dependent methyltransferase [Bdellovibrionales bacterium]
MNDLNAGAHYSPNINNNSEIYEVENVACDPGHLIEEFFSELIDIKGKNILDVGCGAGFHLPYFKDTANHIFGVEPFDESRIQALKRISDQKIKNISILKGTAETVFLKDESIDFAYSRFAYFWGEGCEPGIKEIFRVLKPKGLFCMIDNNLERGTFGPWVKESFKFSDQKQIEVDNFWKDQGFKLKTIDSKWSFKTREDLEKVIRIEFSKDLADKILKDHTSLEIDYAFNLYYKFKN